MSITLELPADLEATLRAEAESQGRDASALVVDLITQRFATAAKYAPLGSMENYVSRDAFIETAVVRASELNADPDLIACLAAGIADAEQGKSYTLDQVRDNLRTALAEQREAKRLS